MLFTINNFSFNASHLNKKSWSCFFLLALVLQCIIDYMLMDRTPKRWLWVRYVVYQCNYGLHVNEWDSIEVVKGWINLVDTFEIGYFFIYGFCSFYLLGWLVFSWYCCVGLFFWWVLLFSKPLYL